MRSGSRPTRLAAAGRRTGAVLALTALSLTLTAGRGVSPGDESWFLLVARRVADGDHLYRDVFYSPLPLAVWVAALPVSLFGAHIAIVEVLAALIWAGTALLLAGHARRAGGGRTASVLAVAALVVVAPPQRNSLYTPLAMLLLVASMILALRYVEGAGGGSAALAGAAAGLSFAAKQTIGLAALAALLLSVALARRPRGSRAAATAIGGFAVVVLPVVLALALSGELGDAWHEGFTGKGEYLAHGSLSYLAALRDAWHLLPSQPTGAFDNLPPLLAPLVGAALLAAAGRRALSTPVIVPAAFAVAAVAGAYPRFSATHLAWANTAVIACAASAVGPRLGAGGRLVAALAAPLAVGCAIAVSLVPLSWAKGELAFSSLPSFRGVPIARASEDAAERVRRGVRPGEPVFFVTEDAAFFTLVSEARDPTPYDVPATSNIGRTEIASLLSGVRTGEITSACFGGKRSYPEEPSLRPLALERALRVVMRPVADLGVCVLHVRRPAPRR